MKEIMEAVAIRAWTPVQFLYERPRSFCGNKQNLYQNTELLGETVCN
jgi:hypothetical protein